MKKLLLLIGLVGCSTSPLVQGAGMAQGAGESQELGGVVCEGAEEWRGAVGCSGACLSIAEGPFFLQEIKTGGACPSNIFVSIRDTYDSSKHYRWEVRAPNWTPMHIQKVNVEVLPGESLFVGSQSKDKPVGCCYVSWQGIR